LMLARCLEHTVSRVPVGGQRNVVEIAMRQPTECGPCVSFKEQARQSQAAPPVQSGLQSWRFDVEIAFGYGRALHNRRLGKRLAPARFRGSKADTISAPALLGQVGAKIAGPEITKFFPIIFLGRTAGRKTDRVIECAVRERRRSHFSW